MVLRTFNKEEKGVYKEFSKKFFSGSAVAHAVDETFFEKTFDEFIDGSPLIDCYAIEYDGMLGGYILIMKAWSNEVGGKQITIDEFFIDGKLRGLGIGSAALSEIFALYKDVKRIRLEVTEQNQGAIKLYKKFGFEMLEYQQMTKEIK